MSSGTNSKSRLFNIHIWDEPWFIELSNTEKLFWIYMNSRCDNIGLYGHSERKANFDIQDSIKADEIESIYNKSGAKIEQIGSSKFLILDFCQFQHCSKSPLLPKAKVFVSYMKDIRNAGLVEYFAKNQPNVVSKDTLAFFKAFESGALDFKNYSNNRSQSNGSTEYQEALNTAMIQLNSKTSQCHNNGIPMTYLSHQGRGKEKGAGKGEGSGLGVGLGNDISSYSLSKNIAEKLDHDYTHELVRQIQALAIRIESETGDQNPHETIDIMLDKLQEYSPESVITVTLIEHELEKIFPKESHKAHMNG